MREERSFAERIEALVRSIDQLNGPQYIGHDALVVKESTRTSSWDLIVPVGYFTQVFRLAADNQSIVAGTIRFHVSKAVSGTPALDTEVAVNIYETSGDGFIDFEAVFYNSAGADLYVKAYVFATDSGAVTLL